GNLFAAIGPIDTGSQGAIGSVGLGDVLAPFGVSLGGGVVEDLDPSVAIPETHGQGFFVSPRVHPVTASLVPGGAGGDEHPPKVAMFFARPLRSVETPGAASASDLLVTSTGAYAKASVAVASTTPDAPPLEQGDARGPFALAMASERERIGPNAQHGPRVVVVGSRFALADDNWRQPHALHGTAFLIDSALSWLAARPVVVDVPDSGEATVAVRISEEGRDEVRRYVLILMPLAALLLGLAVGAWRRSSESAPYVPRADGRGTGAS
ncbi:MAG: GldG family protein, partial [Polyangiaceae bacterium]